MIERLGHALAGWLVPVNAWTAVLLVGALLLDRALAKRTRASLRLALYAPIALRALLPLSWSIPATRSAPAALLLPLDALSTAPIDVRAPWWYALAGVLYIAVAAGLALRTIARRWSLARALVSSTPVDATNAPCPVVRHPELGPMVVGLVAPRIVLPDAMLDGSNESALACVLGHESAHVRRGDGWLAAAIDLVLVVLWPVAPLWIAALRVRHLIELACDEAALVGADAAARRRYGHVLLDVAEQRSIAFATAGSLHFGSTLRARIEAIALQRPWPRAVQASLVGVAVAGFVACSSAGPTATPQATGSARPAASGVDEYGYQFESDPVSNGSHAAVSASTDTRNAMGRLAPEAIQGVVRKSFGAFRKCYESALKNDPHLAGTVSVSFVIAPDGSVQSAADHASTLPDSGAVQCVVGGFGRLTFPPPQGGYVTVVYPIDFKP